MGAWGTGIFENDEALDFICELEDIEDVFSELKSLLIEVKESEEVELDTCEAAIVAVAIIDAVINGTNYEIEDEGFIWAKDNITVEECKILIPIAVTALEVVISEKSELNDLWSESEESYINWKSNIIELRDRLK